MITDTEIENAKSRVVYDLDAHHEHNDCIRIAYEWLDAQNKIKSCIKKSFALKHLIEDWGQRYISQSDVIVAAYLHPDIKGNYPHYNISTRLMLPCDSRLENIGEAGKHTGYDKPDSNSSNYSMIE